MQNLIFVSNDLQAARLPREKKNRVQTTTPFISSVKASLMMLS